MKLRYENFRLSLAECPLMLDTEFDVRAIAILSPSGAGKTSLLEIVAGPPAPLIGKDAVWRRDSV